MRTGCRSIHRVCLRRRFGLRRLVSVSVGFVVWVLLATVLGAGVGPVELALLLVPAIGVGWLVNRRLGRAA